MNKTFGRPWAFLFTFILLFTIPIKVQAKEDLTIPRWNIEAELLKNGNLHIVEDLTYRFDDEFNGVFREIVLDKTSGVSDIEIEEITGTSYIPYTQVEKAKKGDRGVFTLENEDNKVVMQIFSPAEDEEKTFRIGYLVKDVAVKYNDTGELYYKFLGDENQTPINHFMVNLHLPDKDINNHIKVFAHGPLNGQIEKKDNHTFTLRVNDVSPKTFIEGRVVFPKEFIPLSNNIVNKNNYENILKEETGYTREIEEKAQQKRIRNKTFGEFSFVATALGSILLLFFLILFRREKYDLKSYDNSMIPEDCTPGIAAYLTNSIININTIMATFLDLFRKGYIKLEKDKQDKNKSDNDQGYIIYKIKDVDTQLLNHEKYFMNWFINEIGNGSQVTTKEIENFNENHSTKPYTLYNTWIKKIKEEALQLGYFDKSKSKYGTFFIVLFIPLLVLGIITLVYENLWGIGSILVATALVIYGISLLYRRSDYGYEQYKRWYSFKKYMKNQSTFPTQEYIQEQSNNISLIYALGLGVNQSIDDKDYADSMYHEKNFYHNNNWLVWYFLFTNNRNNALAKSIHDPQTGTNSSGGSFPGGGFTGGGGGGAGGGGAGGF